MSYDCSDCDWSTENDVGAAMPRYGFGTEDGERVQVAHCPECQTILDSRENNLRALDSR